MLLTKRRHGSSSVQRNTAHVFEFVGMVLMVNHKDKDANNPSWGIACIDKHGPLSVGELKPTQSKTKVPRSKRLQSGTTKTQKMSCALRLSCFIQKYQWQKAQDLLKLSKTGQTKQRTKFSTEQIWTTTQKRERKKRKKKKLRQHGHTLVTPLYTQT